MTAAKTLRTAVGEAIVHISKQRAKITDQEARIQQLLEQIRDLEREVKIEWTDGYNTGYYEGWCEGAGEDG